MIVRIFDTFKGEAKPSLFLPEFQGFKNIEP